jgi:hypothetical protein
VIMSSATITKAVRSLLQETSEGFSLEHLSESGTSSIRKFSLSEGTSPSDLKGSPQRIDALKNLSDVISKASPQPGIPMTVIDVDGVNRFNFPSNSGSLVIGHFPTSLM